MDAPSPAPTARIYGPGFAQGRESPGHRPFLPGLPQVPTDPVDRAVSTRHQGLVSPPSQAWWVVSGGWPGGWSCTMPVSPWPVVGVGLVLVLGAPWCVVLDRPVGTSPGAPGGLAACGRL